ncbi:zinc carboxypeptidase A 1-like [Bombyx mandarina]|uniref:Zinc carboxypeptidase A 1-like n=1 Tax=Bombyx mandarina TaxID=7092 RepID=A0A6J2JP58_BOMMA|nr:zinc carboxypeptidase A 1-like [Bombyx mandarina]
MDAVDHESKRYDNFILYKATPVEPDHLIFFQNLDRKKYIDVVFWKKPNKLFEDVHFIVNPSDKELLLERAQHFNLDLDVLSENIQRAFDSQIVKNYLRLRVESYSWTNYHNLVDIYQWLADLALKNPSVTGLMSIGKSAEDRDIFVIGINRSGAKSKVIVEGGMHGNEWISTEFLLYLAYNLIMSNRTANERLFELSKNYHWYLLPVCNPDGYEFSHSEDRLWMRNRRNVGHGYFGVDLNRNFDYKFGKHNIIPNSKDDSYGGPVPFSEPESRVIRDFVTKESEGLKYYFSFHAYGQKIVIPYSESKNNMEHDELDRLWMRNRRNVGHGYFGVDLNRNFDYKFGKHNIIPNSKDDSYGGPVPFSEPESRVIRDFVTKESEGLKYYFSFHAYGQKIVIPYSESKNNMEHDELDNLGKQAIIKMFRTSGVKYSISTGYGTSTHFFYEITEHTATRYPLIKFSLPVKKPSAD